MVTTSQIFGGQFQQITGQTSKLSLHLPFSTFVIACRIPDFSQSERSFCCTERLFVRQLTSFSRSKRTRSITLYVVFKDDLWGKLFTLSNTILSDMAKRAQM